jgi:MATE family, multidrug efflux pump
VEGVQATWLALGLGALIVIVVQAAAVPLVSAIAAGGDIAAAALPWLRIAILGAPAILVSLAGTGWMRGLQDIVRAAALSGRRFRPGSAAVPAAGLRLQGLSGTGLRAQMVMGRG